MSREMTTMTVRVIVSSAVQPGQEGAFEAAYREVAGKVAGTPGHLRDELLRAASSPANYLLLSEWESEEQFLAWEEAPVHRELTAPMRPYWAGHVERRIYHVAARPDSVR
jgi:heme-degrading monooxygenase HmoA